MNACRDHELSLSLRAAGALDPAEAARLEAHLAGCAACRAEAAAVEDALRLAKLPPVSELERRALAGLPERALAAQHLSDARRSRRRRYAKRIGIGLVAAAAAIVVMYQPFRQRPPEAPAMVAAAETWESPDLDSVWSDAGVLDLSESEDDYLDVTLAAFDASGQ